MIKPILLSIQVVTAVGFLGFITRQAEAACTVSKVSEFHVTIENDQILIPAVINGEKVKILLDTGIPANIMPSSSTGRLGLALTALTNSAQMSNQHDRVNGVVTSDGSGTTNIPELLLDGKTMRGVLFAVFRSNDNFGGPDVVAAISSYIWRSYEVDIDLAHSLITLLKAEDCAGANLAYWGDAYNVVDLTDSNYGAQFPIKINGRELTAVLDSGSPYSTLSDKAAARVGLDRPGNVLVVDALSPVGVQATDLLSMISFSRGYGLAATAPNVLSSNSNDLGPQTPKSYWPARIDKLAIDQEVISSVSMRVVPTPKVGRELGTRTPRNLTTYDALLGVDFLKAHRVLISHSQKKLYFSYLGGEGFGKQD